MVIGESENKFVKNIIHIKDAVISAINKDNLSLFRGSEILYICINPVVASNNTANVDVSISFRFNILDANSISIVLITTVIDVGNATLDILNKKLGFTFSLFGSNASINDGIPIVNTLIKVNCIGI